MSEVPKTNICYRLLQSRIVMERFRRTFHFKPSSEIHLPNLESEKASSAKIIHGFCLFACHLVRVSMGSCAYKSRPVIPFILEGKRAFPLN
jgi:hypothetical protein